MLRYRALGFSFTVAFFLASGCASTTRYLKEQKLALLESENAEIARVTQILVQTPSPDGTHDLSAFLAVDAINQVLSMADGTSMPLSGLQGVRLHIVRVRSNFKHGFPGVTAEIWAVRGSLSVQLSAAIRIVVRLDETKPGIAYLDLRVESVVPVARWLFFQWQFRGFVRDLLHASASQYAASLPGFPVPLRYDLPVDIKENGRPPCAKNEQPARFDANDHKGYIEGCISIPTVSTTIHITLDRAIFLADGIHLYINNVN